AALQNAVMSNPDAARQIASTIMAAAEVSGAADDEIGAGMAQGASAIADGASLVCPHSDEVVDRDDRDKSCNAMAAAAVARAVASQGTNEEVLAFESTATSLGNTELASIAGGGSETTGENGGGGGFNRGSNNQSFYSGNGGSGGGCLN